jgi:3-dehydroquinate synthase
MRQLSCNKEIIYLNSDFSKLHQIVPELLEKDVFYIIDESVYLFHSSKFSALKNIILVPSAEKTKSISHVEVIINQLLNLNANRKSFVIGIGGGVICDLVGFVSSIFMRGVDFGFIPTTLLSMTDASIGGKNGVNFNSIKNLIGVINDPKFIFIDYSFLKTLPNKEWLNGFSEIIKHACICSIKFFNFLENNSKIFKSYKACENLAKFDQLVFDSISIKIDYVKSDKNEIGRRKLLNFGHTFGHAIESKYSLTHGESVSLGIVFSNEIANSLKFLSLESNIRVRKLLSDYSLPINISSFDKQSLTNLIYKDKKSSKDKIDFIVLNKIGSALIHSVKIKEIFNE